MNILENNAMILLEKNEFFRKKSTHSIKINN